MKFLYEGALDIVSQKSERNRLNYHHVSVFKTSKNPYTFNKTPLPKVTLTDIDHIISDGPFAMYDEKGQIFVGIYMIKYSQKYIISPQYYYTYSTDSTDYFAKYGAWTCLVLITPIAVAFDLATGTVAMTECVLIFGLTTLFIESRRCMAIPRSYLDMSR